MIAACLFRVSGIHRERNYSSSRSTSPITVQKRTAMCKSQLEPIIENPGNTRGWNTLWVADSQTDYTAAQFVCNAGCYAPALIIALKKTFRTKIKTTCKLISLKCLTNKRHFAADVDECQDHTHICHLNAHCNNTIGSFNCTCLQGYWGDGVDCYGTCIVN